MESIEFLMVGFWIFVCLEVIIYLLKIVAICGFTCYWFLLLEIDVRQKPYAELANLCFIPRYA